MPNDYSWIFVFFNDDAVCMKRFVFRQTYFYAEYKSNQRAFLNEKENQNCLKSWCFVRGVFKKSPKKHKVRAPSRPKMTTLTMKTAFLELAAGSAGSARSGGNGAANVRSDPPPTRAGGQDDGS